MKKISIITGSELRQVQGVNYYIKSFIECNSLFKEVVVDKVYSSLQVLDVEAGDTMPIGADTGSREYAVRTCFRTFLRKLLTDKFYPFALFRYELNFYHNSHNSVIRYFEDYPDSDYIIFQEIGCAYYYFKLLNKYANNKKPKTSLVIHSEDDSGSMLMDRFTGWGRKDMKRRFDKRRDYVYSKIDKVIYISEKAYNNSILPVSKRGFVYNGSPNVNYTFNEISNKVIQFVCVGSFAGRKGQDKVIEALKILDSVLLSKLHVTFVGDGPELDKTKAKATEYNLNEYVTFAGRRNDVAEILRDKDVFIMPSLVEGLPMSAIEAMRAGLYLILTDTGGNMELCKDGCGEICTREPEDIVKHIISVINESVISKQQKENSRNRFIKCFSLDSMAKGYESLLESM